MSEIAITAHEIGKAYSIRHHTGKTYKTLQADFIGWLKAPFRRENTETFWALKDISFEIKQGEVVGIIGRNGAGKSTLLKILSRITRPTTGYAELTGRVGSLLEVGTGFHPELTGRENIFLNGAVLGMDRASIRRRFDEIVAFAEVEQFLDTPVKRYSSGMYMRLAFAVAAHLDPEILVVDEVLAVGDAEFQKKSMGKMSDVAQSGRTVLFVSHNMGAIEKLCTRAILLDRGKIITDGNIRETVTRYLSQSNLNEVTFENRAVKRVSIRQVGDCIELIADYEWKTPIALPCLGFVIRDFMGNPLFGTNPMVEKIQPLENPQTSGTVKVLIKSPHLLSGIYRLSVWFGNGYEDFFYEPDCLLLEIVNKAYVHSLPPSEVGSIVPECEWEFTG